MFQDIMRVTRLRDRTWQARTTDHAQSFRIKSHAVAYARAVSWSKQLTLFVDDDRGTPLRQSRASMTYPVQLD